jgi:segregation and condensation protein B
VADDAEARRAIEAILMVADQPVPPQLLGELLERSAEQVEDLCTELATEYDVTARGFVIARVAGGYRFQSAPDLAAHVERFVLEGQTARLSRRPSRRSPSSPTSSPSPGGRSPPSAASTSTGVLRTLPQRGFVPRWAWTPAPAGDHVRHHLVILGAPRARPLADLPPRSVTSCREPTSLRS